MINNATDENINLNNKFGFGNIVNKEVLEKTIQDTIKSSSLLGLELMRVLLNQFITGEYDLATALVEAKKNILDEEREIEKVKLELEIKESNAIQKRINALNMLLPEMLRQQI